MSNLFEEHRKNIEKMVLIHEEKLRTTCEQYLDIMKAMQKEYDKECRRVLKKLTDAYELDESDDDVKTV